MSALAALDANKNREDFIILYFWCRLNKRSLTC